MIVSRGPALQKASKALRLTAFFTNLLFAGLVTEIIYAFSGLAPVPNLQFWSIFAFIFVTFEGLGRLRLLISSNLSSDSSVAATPGEWIWGIRRRGELKIPEVVDGSSNGIFLTTILFILGFIVFEAKIAKTPQWMSSTELKLDAVLPPSDWRVLAFHYSLAAWPPAEAYSIPYEFGPPKRFVGKVEAFWPDDEKLILEGPKTPFPFQSGEVPRQELKRCFMEASSLHCASIRQISLERPLQEMKKLGYANFEVRWFSAENPLIAPEERAQGIFLRGSGGKLTERRYQDRYILVSQKGMHQSLILSYLHSESGPEKVRMALGTLRFSDDLNQGRAWVNRELESMRLDDLPSPDSNTYLPRLVEAEGLLVSKISVEPGPIETYYHLAGIQSLLIQYGKKHAHPELIASAKQMLDQVYRFSRDIAAQEPSNSPTAYRARAIEKLWHDSLQF